VYSGAAYNITAYVKEKTDKSGYYVYAIGATIELDDEGNKPANAGEKIVAPPGGDGSGGITGNFSQIIFTNKYTKNQGGTDPVKDSVLAISHAISGDFGDKTKSFAYTVTVTKPATEPNANKTYKAYVMDEAGKIVTNISGIVASQYIKNDATYGNYIEFKTADPVNVNLIHGQYLSFVDLQVGASFASGVAGEVDYTPGYGLTLDGVTGTGVTGTANTALSFTAQRVGEKANAAAFVNTYKNITPTGISVDSLPYVSLIAAAAIALVAYVIVKSRKASDKDA